ncbi:kinase-like domain-containing protein [Pilaira anomala]|nr:kinase-like domain-containing protein [Pilaira anomala]
MISSLPNTKSISIIPLFDQPSTFQPYQLNNRFSSLYKLVDRIGSGGYGFVMSAINRATKQEVAVKFIYKEKLARPLQEPLEINILRRIHHPTVINYIDSFEDQHYFYLVMELYGCEWKAASSSFSPSSSASHQSSSSSISSPVTPDHNGIDHFSTSFPSSPQQKVRRTSCDLFECIERHNRLSEVQTQKIFKQIVQCVDDLSSIGIYHRDIKDENIVVDSEFNVKLIDFGSAIQIPQFCSRDEYTIKEFHGTISFASPEILLGLSYRPEPAEVWSLGILLFTLLYGQVPFSNSNQVISGNWSRFMQPKSSDCMDLLHGLLKNNPQKRFTVKQILQHPWMNNNFV